MKRFLIWMGGGLYRQEYFASCLDVFASTVLSLVTSSDTVMELCVVGGKVFCFIVGSWRQPYIYNRKE